MTDPQEAAEIAAAVKAAAESRSIVLIPQNAGPAMREALVAHATETAKMVLPTPLPSRTERLAEEYAGSALPTVSMSDHREFLANIEDIARGRKRAVLP